jgi:beta-N-acetylhexosaminidase
MERHIGRLFMIGFEGTETTPELRDFIHEQGIGGVILFRENIVSKGQTARLVGRLKEEAGAVPLLVAIDQEGGRVNRLPSGFGSFPSMAEVAKKVMESGDPSVAYTAAEKIAQVLKSIGVNFDLAPVLDVGTNPWNPVIGDRAFGPDPDQVAQLGVQFIRGLMGGGILACGKHFPGHGDTDTDSHLELPVLHHTRKRLEACEWKPFRAAIEDGLPAIMTAHMMVPNLDKENPASISHYITTRVLRQELGFNGVVITDDLTMGGISRRMSVGEAAVRAVKAGADIIIISKDMAKQREAIKAVKEAVNSGYIPEEQLTSALTRISNLKNNL